MSEREKALRAQLWLGGILLVAALLGALLVQDSFMLWPAGVAAAHLAYRFGRLDELQDLIKINSQR
jgi:hypothetical protein